MENGHEERLADEFLGMSLNDCSRSPENDAESDTLLNVRKAVEAAEVTIKEQVEENYRLRTELQEKIQELEKYKSDEPMARRSNLGDQPKSNEPMARRPNLGDQPNANFHEHYKVHHLVAGGSLDDRIKSTSIASIGDPSVSLALHPHPWSGNDEADMNVHRVNQYEGSMIKGKVRGPAGGAGLSRFSSPSTLLRPMRLPTDGELGPHSNLSAQGLMPMTEVNNSNSLSKQDIICKIREQEEEISRLRKQLSDYSVKEAQIRNEKYVLEKRIEYMRLAFDQQQQDLVDAASKALSYRQEIIEENVRLTYALQAAQQGRSTFMSSLMLLLAEYSLQPQVSDAQSVVSNVKVLFRHLQEKLLLTESKLEELEYQLAPWHSDMNHANIAPMSTAHSVGTELTTSNNNALDLVAQHQYSHGHPATDWDLLHHHRGGPDGSAEKNFDSVELGRGIHLFQSRNLDAQEMPEKLSQEEAHGAR